MATVAEDSGTGGEVEDGSADTTGDSIFTGDGQRLNQGPMTIARAFALLLHHDERSSAKGFLIVFVNSASDQSTVHIAARLVDGSHKLIKLDRTGQLWTLDDPSFRNQRFATLAELVFYYSARNRHIVPVDLASAQEREQQSEPSEELLERGAAIARQFEVGGFPRQVSDASGMEDDDDDVLPPLSSVLSGNRRASGDTNFRQRAMTVPASVAAPEPQATAVPASVVTTEPQASDDGRLQNTFTDGHIEYTFAPNTRQERAHTVSEPNNTDMASRPTDGQGAISRGSRAVNPSRLSIESSIQREAAAIVNDDMNADVFGALSTAQTEAQETHVEDVGCMRTCCLPICVKCSAQHDAGLLQRCSASSALCLRDRCGCGGRTEADSPPDVTSTRRTKSVWRVIGTCCCYVDTAEEPVYAMRRRGVVPLAGLFVAHLAWGIVYFFIMIIKVVLAGTATLYAVIQDFNC
eukprot:scpid55848/ scgid4980/ 